ncbi:hypothetical protein [Nostoc parmelioides]|uniref:Uncharacterized protein n=1 Tax=Nostoc parmelioides FACHB-3921 TaxID=2692909 RepID=A0ABR8BET9_9NOSO|nr:hypothetical protein [Nostoc parmelioides]MBD2252612.1 hypothetical protein [Nostoc parmelioides FACHB-3921]
MPLLTHPPWSAIVGRVAVTITPHSFLSVPYLSLNDKLTFNDIIRKR